MARRHRRSKPFIVGGRAYHLVNRYNRVESRISGDGGSPLVFDAIWFERIGKDSSLRDAIATVAKNIGRYSRGKEVLR